MYFNTGAEDSQITGKQKSMEAFGSGQKKVAAIIFHPLQGKDYTVYSQDISCQEKVMIYIYILLGGGFQYSLFSPLPGEDSHFD